MRKLPPLKAIQAFEAAARLSSFAVAADELRVTPPAISHQIRLLEREVGLALFHRVHRTVHLTDAGRAYAEKIGEAFGMIEAATRIIDRTVKADILTVHSAPSFATQWLMPRLSRFSVLNPDTDVRLNAAVATVDLGAGEADFAIRYGTSMPAQGVAVAPFPEETFVVACTPSLAKGKQAIRKPADIERHTLIYSEVNLVTWRDWLDANKLRHIQTIRGPRFDRTFMAINAAVDGLGIVFESRMMLQREVDAGRLVLPLGKKGPRLVCHSLHYLKSKANLPKIRAVREWLMAELAATEM
jgi:LysR family glycine cleavage system transcriptional activator